MVSSCKICGVRTAGHRQYCPRCRITHKGRKNDPLTPLIKEIAPLIINGLPFLVLGYGYYQISLGQIGLGVLLFLFGSLLWWGMIYSKKQRGRFHDRNLGTKTDLRNLNNKPDKFGVTAFWVGIIVFLIIMLFVMPPTKWVIFNSGGQVENDLSKDSSTLSQIENSNSNEQTTSFEEELLNFCKVEFNKIGDACLGAPNNCVRELKDSNYFDDYDSASDWIEDKYPNEGMTINRARFFKEWYLDKSEFPIYILEGRIKTNEKIISEDGGVYACDKTGIIVRN